MTGTMIVIVTKSGNVAASEADFDMSAPAGYSVSDAQERRAKDRAWRRVMMEFCHSDIGEAISGLALDIVRRNLRAAGWKEHAASVTAP